MSPQRFSGIRQTDHDITVSLRLAPGENVPVTFTENGDTRVHNYVTVYCTWMGQENMVVSIADHTCEAL